MSTPTYWFEKINEAINKPKGDHANIAIRPGGHIDNLLEHSQNSPNFSEIEKVAAEIKDYIDKNLRKKFGTKAGARELVSKLKELVETEKNALWTDKEGKPLWTDENGNPLWTIE